MASLMPEAHGTIRFIIGSLVVGVLLFFGVGAYERAAARSKESCAVDLSVSQREVKRLESILESDGERSKEVALANIKAATASLAAQRDVFKKERDAAVVRCDKQLAEAKALATAQMEALKAIPTEQSQVFQNQMKGWGDECSRIVARADAIARGRQEECARAAESVVRICKPPEELKYKVP